MAPVTRETLEERWACATRDVKRFADVTGISGVVSERWLEVDAGLGELAAFLVEEVSDVAGDEVDSLTTLTEGLWELIRERTIAWALDVEVRRNERGKAAAA